MPHSGHTTAPRSIQPVSLNRERQKPYVASQRTVRPSQRSDFQDPSITRLVASTTSWPRTPPRGPIVCRAARVSFAAVVVVLAWGELGARSDVPGQHQGDWSEAGHR